MPIDKLSANAFATGAVANSLGYTPANKAGDTFTGNVVFSANATVTGAATFSNTVTVTGNVLVNTTVAPVSSGKFAINSGISSSSVNVLELQQATDGANKAAAAFGVSIQNGGQNTNASDLYISTASGGSLVQRGRFDSSGNFQFNSGYGSVATAYGCRAWVRFNGTNGTIIGSGNVSSVSDNGSGNFAVNFTTAMPDTNWAGFVTTAETGGTGASFTYHGTLHSIDSTTSVGVNTTAYNIGTTLGDVGRVNVSIFR